MAEEKTPSSHSDENKKPQKSDVAKEEKNTLQNTSKKEQKSQNNATTDMRYSGFWVRGAAHIIDMLVVGALAVILLIPVSFIFGFISGMFGSGIVTFFVQMMMFFFGLLLTWGYFVFMTYKYQATLGKMAVGAKVTAENGEKLSLGGVILRETIGKLVSSLVFGVGYIMIAFTKKKQGLHDFMAHSVVVYKDKEKGANSLAVGVTYGVYGCFTVGMMLLFAAIMIIAMIGLAFFGTKSTPQGSFPLDEYGTHGDMDMMDHMYDDDTLDLDDVGDLEELLDNLQDIQSDIQIDGTSSPTQSL